MTPQPDKTDDEIIRNFFDNPEGMNVLAILMDKCFFHQSPYDDNPQRMAQNCGRRELVNEIVQLMSWPKDPQKLVEMAKKGREARLRTQGVREAEHEHQKAVHNPLDSLKGDPIDG